MVTFAADLAQLVQRRELMAYEQRVARSAYAYGVDLRRSAWLEHSTFGEPLMRVVDRRWNRLTEMLEREALQPPSEGVPHALLETIARLVRLLRAPVPTVRAVKPGSSLAPWPLATALGTTAGGAHWLVLDVDALLALSEESRRFWIGAALGHLQCDHGPLFAAHLMLHAAPRGLGLIRTALRPWSRVAVFSADRAGLLAVGELDVALRALGASQSPSWFPPPPPFEAREQALRDFDQSRIMARLRLAQVQLDAEPPVGVDPMPVETPEHGTDSAAPAEADAKASESPAEVEEKIKEAWSLARCDERLTRRLGLL